MWEKYVIAAS